MCLHKEWLWYLRNHNTGTVYFLSGEHMTLVFTRVYQENSMSSVLFGGKSFNRKMTFVYFSPLVHIKRFKGRTKEMSFHRILSTLLHLSVRKRKWHSLQQVLRAGSDPIEYSSTTVSSCLQTFHIAMLLSINLWNWRVMDLGLEQACLSCEIDFSSGLVVFGVHKVLSFPVSEDLTVHPWQCVSKIFN